MTLINNNGVTKAPRMKPTVDVSKAATVSVSYRGRSVVSSVKDIKNARTLALKNGTDVAVTIPPGEVAMLEFTLD